MSELPPDPARLRVILAHLEQQIAETETIGIYLRLQRDAVRQALTAADRQPAPAARPNPPPTPVETDQPTGYKLEPKKHPTAPQPALIHRAACTMPHQRTMPVDETEARIGLRDRIDGQSVMEPCQFCRPDTSLGILD